MKKNITLKKPNPSLDRAFNLNITVLFFLSGLTFLFAQKQDSLFYKNTKSIKAIGWTYNQQKDSIWMFFYPNGTLQKKGLYDKNEKQGVWNFFLPSGKPSFDIEYSNGKVVRQQSYLHKNGTFELLTKPTDSL